GSAGFRLLKKKPPPAASKKIRTATPTMGLLNTRAPSARVQHSKLQLMPAIVDDQCVEQSERIHADQNGRFARQAPLLENIQVAKSHAGIVNGDRAQADRRRRHELALLNVFGGADDGVDLRSRR